MAILTIYVLTHHLWGYLIRHLDNQSWYLILSLICLCPPCLPHSNCPQRSDLLHIYKIIRFYNKELCSRKSTAKPYVETISCSLVCMCRAVLLMRPIRIVTTLQSKPPPLLTLRTLGVAWSFNFLPELHKKGAYKAPILKLISIYRLQNTISYNHTIFYSI